MDRDYLNKRILIKHSEISDVYPGIRGTIERVDTDGITKELIFLVKFDDNRWFWVGREQFTFEIFNGKNNEEK